MIKDVEKFMEVADQIDRNTFSLYIGLICEEMLEMLGALGFQGTPLEEVEQRTKSGEIDLDELSHEQQVELLDGLLDMIWVTIGAAISMGADVEGAWREVTASNMSKFWGWDDKLYALRDKNGKVMKPPHYRRPELAKFLKVGDGSDE